ncbi:MAG: hypothetical protein Q7T56_14500 [Nocardioidaceae bacterium]|nr:hypothetical protein [Nocardioidaceae bacterium]
MPDGPERTEDGRYVVVDGRRWRAQDPEVPDDVAARLRSHLGRGRSGVGVAKRAGDDAAVSRARERVGLAKHGLGERGEAWWDLSLDERRRRWDDALRDLDALDDDS